MIIKSKYKEILLNIFAELTIPVEVWAYGSRVDGTAHEGSDLDLVLDTPDGARVPLDILEDLREKISESNIPILVDLFDRARLPESFQSNINSSHEIFWTSMVSAVNEPEPKLKRVDPSS